MNDLAQALQDASVNASNLENLLLQNGDAAGAQQADEAQRNLLNAAGQVNAVDVMQKLATTADNQKNLTDLTTGMNAATAALAKDEANIAKFVSLGTDALKLAAAVTGGLNIAGAMGAIQSMLGTLGIA